MQSLLTVRDRKIRIERGHLLGEHQSLVDDGLRGARANVEFVGMRRAASALADRVERVLERLAGAGAPDEQLQDGRPRVARHGTDRRAVDGHLAPAEHALSVVHHRGLENRLLLAAPPGIAREEAHRDRVVARRRQLHLFLGHLCGEQRMRQLQEHACSVAGARVAAGRPPVGEVLEDLETLLYDLVGRNAAERGDEPEPARIVLERRIIEPLACR